MCACNTAPPTIGPLNIWAFGHWTWYVSDLKSLRNVQCWMQLGICETWIHTNENGFDRFVATQYPFRYGIYNWFNTMYKHAWMLASLASDLQQKNCGAFFSDSPFISHSGRSLCFNADYECEQCFSSLLWNNGKKKYLKFLHSVAFFLCRLDRFHSLPFAIDVHKHTRFV